MINYTPVRVDQALCEVAMYHAARERNRKTGWTVIRATITGCKRGKTSATINTDNSAIDKIIMHDLRIISDCHYKITTGQQITAVMCGDDMVALDFGDGFATLNF